MDKLRTNALPVREIVNPDPFEPMMKQQPGPAVTDGFVPVRCVCNKLLCEALPGSTVKIVCPRCGAFVLWPARAVEVLPREKPPTGGPKLARLETKAPTGGPKLAGTGT